MKILRMLLAVVIAFGAASAPGALAHASAPPSVKAAPSASGELVNVTINGSGVSNLYGVQLQISYDETALQFVSAKPRYFAFASQSQVNTDAYDLLDTAGASVGFQYVTAVDGVINCIMSQVKQGMAVSANTPVLDLQFRALRADETAITVEKTKLMELLHDQPSPLAGGTLSLSLSGNSSSTGHGGSGSTTTATDSAAGFKAAIEAILKDATLNAEQKKERIKAYIAAHLPALSVYAVPAGNVSGGGSSSSPVHAVVNAQAVRDAAAAYAELLKQIKALEAAAGVNDPLPSVFRIQLPQTANAKSVQVDLPADVAMSLKQAELSMLIETSIGSLAGNPDAFWLPANAQTAAITISKLSGSAGTGIQATLQIDQAAAVRFPGPVQLSFPYVLAPDQKADRVIVVQVQEDGSETPVVNSWYDADHGRIMFRTVQTGSFIVKTNSSSFSDLQSHWSKNAVEQLADRGIIKGKTASRFDPQGEVTREEFAALIVRAFELTADTSGHAPSPFTDVAADSWSSDAIQTAYKLGIVKGTSASAFEPKKSITREELAVMLAKAAQAAQLQLPSTKAANAKDLAEASAFATASLTQLLQAGIMQGDGNGAVNPRQSATRAESAMMIFKALMLFRP
ncbi:S-layer homology domain-containing protein [Paenibacillus glycanilyticus]|uniref:SLH domain-containing protein n=1 Tax=Paenibacillus glycanilyticus TaxID=126569 RepID=A0ABQ6GKP2_9BACL|nr:S-layer homology domain-containing protein [Paenibacillus glycanilyticus]GLX71491.1 hypothetical protein MU1_58410 [Paenibacillus glycanilyticus]